MTATPHDTKGTVSAKERLQASREALLHQLMPSTRPQPQRPTAPGAVPRTEAAATARAAGLPPHNPSTSGARAEVGRRGGGTWSLAKHSLNAWWQFHPARAVVAIAEPVMAEYAQRRPWKLLGIAAGVGAAVVVIKPWKLVSAGGLALAALKSSHVSNAALSLLSARKASTSADKETP